eukprot:c24377_g2_i1 orf=637-2196(-)
MGSSASKQQSKKDGWNTPLAHSISMPTKWSRLEAVEGRTKMPWTSKLLSMPKLMDREGSFGSFFGLSSSLRPVQEEEFGAFQEELPELKEEQVSPVGAFKARNENSLRRSVSFQPTLEPSPGKISISHKSFKEVMIGSEMSNALDLSVKTDPVPDSVRPPYKDAATDRSVGLRSLLNPVLTPSRSFASPTRQALDPKKTLAPMRSFNSRNDDIKPVTSGFFARSSSFRDSSVIDNRGPEWVSTSDSLAEPGSSPLFDPSILATFENALEHLSNDGHQSSDSSTIDNNSSASESESSSDVDGLQLSREGIDCFENFESVIGQDGRVHRSPKLRTNAFLKRTISFSRVFSLKSDDKNWTGKDYLDRFEMICPPGGEGKVVLYFTSLRAVRKTFEDCCMLRLILKGLRVHVDERDVWMHSKFRKELTDVMGATLPVPRLFISGRYIGGAEEVEQLHEEGILGKMLEEMPMEWRQECVVCGDVRFIPCITCSGSCKTVSEEGMIERCSDCNENGLIMCPSCVW